MTQILAKNSCQFGVQANKMSALGCSVSIFVVLVIFGSGCEPLLPPVLSPWQDFCQLGCETLASPVGNRHLASLSPCWKGGPVQSRNELYFAVIGFR